METEVRFSVSKAKNKQVERWLSKAESEVQNSESIYFDTKQNALRKAGVELRLRRNHKGLKQTIKSVGPKGSLFSRAESEIEIADFEPQLQHLKKILRDQKITKIDASKLIPSFRTQVKRTVITKPYTHGVVESVYDVGRIEAGSGKLALSEVEHELKEGSADALVESCHSFLDQVPCSIGLEGKAARGYRLATGQSPEPVFAAKTSMPANTLTPDAIRLIFQSSFQHAMANLPVYVQTGDMEAVHQFRVGLRRFRAAISSFSPILELNGASQLVGQVKSIFESLGELRDADVFLDETLESLSQSILPEKYNGLLRDEVSNYRKKKFGQVKNVLESTEFARFIVDMNAWIDSDEWLLHDRPVDELIRQRPIGDFAEGRLLKMNKKLLKLGAEAESGTLDDWHRLRIMTKKVRYASEPLITVIGGKDGPAYAKSLSRLQDTLGKINDLNSISRFLNDVEQGLSAQKAIKFKEASAFCVGWGAARADSAVTNLLPSWHRFSKSANQFGVR